MRNAMNVPGAPEALGPYSHAQVVRLHGGNRIVFTSGQVGLNPETKELAEGVKEQTKQALTNLATVLSGAGLTLADVVKTTVFLVDIADWATVNEVYARVVPQPFPARSAFAVRELPKGAKVEIEAVAAV